MATIDWILVCDRTRAKLFHALPAGQGPFPVLACLIHEQGKLSSQERNTDKPGRVVHPAGWQSAVEPHEDADHLESRRFASELVEDLERGRQERRFDRLIVVAPPKFLGVLREAWTPSLKALICTEIAQDWMTLPAAELQERLEALCEVAT